MPTRKITIATITQDQGTLAVPNVIDLTDKTKPAKKNKGDVTVGITYLTDVGDNDRVVLQFSVHLTKKETNAGDSIRRHQKGDDIFQESIAIKGNGATAVTEEITFPAKKLRIPGTVYVIHVRDRNGLCASSRNVFTA